MGVHLRENVFSVQSVFVAMLVLGIVALRAQQNENRWWPVQALPRAFVRVTNPPDVPAQMMVQSLAGLAAKAVNEGRGNELVWVDRGNPNLAEWLARWREANPR
jgi:hypothetical protein